MKRALLSHALARFGIPRARRLLRVAPSVIIINYHRIGEGSNSLLDRGLWSVSSEMFREQVRFLSEHYNVIGPGDIRGALDRSQRRCAMITFDDGYIDNFTIAAPILREMGVTATFFVTTGFIGTRRLAWWDEVAWMVRRSEKENLKSEDEPAFEVVLDNPDRLQAINRLQRLYKDSRRVDREQFLDVVAKTTGSGRYPQDGESCWMDWRMVRELVKQGFTVGGHTINHPMLASAADDVQLGEVHGCASDLAENSGVEMLYFSYPDGGLDCYGDATQQALRDVGVELAFVQEAGSVKAQDFDPLAVRRVAIDQHVDMHWFRCLLEFPSVFGKTWSFT